MFPWCGARRRGLRIGVLAVWGWVLGLALDGVGGAGLGADMALKGCICTWPGVRGCG